MTPGTPRAYDGAVDVLRNRASRWIAAGLGALLACLAAPLAPAGAGTSSFDVGDQVVVNVTVRGRGNDVMVHTWDRPNVQVDYAEDNPPAVERHVTAFGTVRNPLAQQIPPQLFAMHDANGQPNGGGALPPEEFPYASFRPGPHEVVHVDAPQGSHLVVTLPASTGILVMRVGGGQTAVEGFRGANLFLIQGQGRMQITGATTTAFVQMNYGVFYTADSTFDRIRVRGVSAHDVFERCRSKQIEASSVTGSLVYDGGSFDPGLARFESQTGSIALGVTSPAQLAGRSQDGHVYTMFDKRGGASVDQHGDGEAVATVGGGGPLVSAISGRGNVYFYDGSLVNRRVTSPEWRAVHQLFNQHRRADGTGPAGRVRRPAR